MTEAPRVILDGIGAGAEAELAAIEAAVAAYEAGKAAEAAARAEALVREAEDRLRERVAAIEAAAASRLALELRRSALASRERVIRETVARVTARFAELVGSPGYAELLRGWIVEAAVGLGAGEAVVATSPSERRLLTEELLRRAEGEAEAPAGMAVRLSAGADDLPSGQGVTLTARGGRTAFDNRVEARLRRGARAIRRMVQEELFPDEAGGADGAGGTGGRSERA